MGSAIHDHSCFHLLSNLPSARELHVTETTWQHVAQRGRAWYGTESHGFLQPGVCAPPGTQCGGKLSSITHVCMCQGTGKFHNPHAHAHTRVTQEIKNLTRSACILQRVEHLRSLRCYEGVEHVLGSHTTSPPQTCSLTSITFRLGCCYIHCTHVSGCLV